MMMVKNLHESSKFFAVPVVNTDLGTENTPFSQISVSIGLIHLMALGAALLAVPLGILVLGKFWFGDYDHSSYDPFIDYAREEVLNNPYSGVNFNVEKKKEENLKNENFTQKFYEIRDDIRNEILYYLNLVSDAVSYLSKKTHSLPLSRVRDNFSSVKSGNYPYENPHYDSHWTRPSTEPLYH